MAQADPLAYYPGHCYLETALFGQDSAQSSSKPKLLSHIIHKRDLPNDTENHRINFPHNELHTSTDQIPDGSLQVIRFVGLPRNAPESGKTHQDRRVLASVFSALGFPLAHVTFALNSSRVEQGRLFAGNETDIDSSKNPAFYAAGTRFCVIWRFRTDTKSTRVVIVNYAPSAVQLVTRFTSNLGAAVQYFNQSFGHPMFITILLTYHLRFDAMSPFDLDTDVLSAIENQVTLKSANRISTMQQLRDLGRLISRSKFILSALRSSLEQARLFNERAYADKKGNFKDSTSKHFLAHLELQRGLVDLDVMFLENKQESIAHQQIAISTMVNMQDSASMKTVAVITMVFLPGTFCASVFAMPVFPQARHDAFWLYWAVCIPLTAIVLLAWLTWFYWHTVSKYYDNPQDTLLNDLKAWWRDSNGSEGLRAKNSSHHYLQRRLAGDTYKEWIEGFSQPQSRVIR